MWRLYGAGRLLPTLLPEAPVLAGDHTFTDLPPLGTEACGAGRSQWQDVAASDTHSKHSGHRWPCPGEARLLSWAPLLCWLEPRRVPRKPWSVSGVFSWCSESLAADMLYGTELLLTSGIYAFRSRGPLSLGLPAHRWATPIPRTREAVSHLRADHTWWAWGAGLALETL